MASLLEIMGEGLATLTFTRKGVKTGVDPKTGNPVFAESTFEMKAKLDQVREAPAEAERFQTGNVPQLFVSGYCVEPETLPR